MFYIVASFFIGFLIGSYISDKGNKAEIESLKKRVKKLTNLIK